MLGHGLVIWVDCGPGSNARSGFTEVLVVGDEPEVAVMFREWLRWYLRFGRYDVLFASCVCKRWR